MVSTRSEPWHLGHCFGRTRTGGLPVQRPNQCAAQSPAHPDHRQCRRHPHAPWLQSLCAVANRDAVAAANTGADLLALQTGSPTDRADEYISLVSEGMIAPPAHAKSKKMKGICLVNPVESGGSVAYILNDTECSLRPGQVHQLPAGEYKIQFDKGDNHGSASYDLGEHTYVFYNDQKKGWSLYSKTFQVTLDNSANPNPFAAVVDGKPVSIAPRKSKKFKSAYPLLLAFDPGDGSKPARRWLIGSTYKVGIGAQTALLDLFSQSQASAARKPMPSREVAVE